MKRIDQKGVMFIVLIAVSTLVLVVGFFIVWQVLTSSPDDSTTPVYGNNLSEIDPTDSLFNDEDKVVQQQLAPNPNNLVESIYPASDRSAQYSVLFLPNQLGPGTCMNVEGVCGGLVGSKSGRPVVQLFIFDTAKDESIEPMELDGQCDESSIKAVNNGKTIPVCEAVLGGMVFYYKFELELGGRTHLGMLYGNNVKGRAFTDVSIYDDELVTIIESIELED